MRIQGKGAKAYDADMVTRFFEASLGTKVNKREAETILSDTAHELRDNFEGSRSSRGLTSMVNALKRTAKELAKSGNLTSGAEDAIASWLGTGGDLEHAMADIKSEVAYNRRQYSPPPRRRSYGT